MEFRYVYRRVEDAIGSPLSIDESRHSGITRRMRHDVREFRDIAHKTEVTALCLASLAGNSSLDASKMVDSVSRLLDIAQSQALPYIKLDEDVKPTEPRNDYAAAFAELARFTEELNAQKAKKAAELVEQAGSGDSDRK